MFDDCDGGVIVPIQIRENHYVRVGRIPHDLTLAEARKIADVVMAYAPVEETERGSDQ